MNENIKELFSNNKLLKTYIKKHPEQFNSYMEDNTIYNQVIDTATNTSDIKLIKLLIKNNEQHSHIISKISSEEIKSDVIKNSIIKEKLSPALLNLIAPSELLKYIEFAIDHKQHSAFKLLLEEATHMQYSDKNALLYSVSNNSFKLLQYLIQNDDINPRLENDIVLITACETQNIDIIKYLLTLDLSPNVDNGYPLKISCEKNNLQLVKLLVDYDADISKNNHQAMLIALENNNVELVKYLYEKRYKNIKQPILMPTIKEKLLYKFKKLSDVIFYYNFDDEPLDKMLKFVKNTGSQELIDYLLSEGADQKIVKNRYQKLSN